MNRIFSHAAQCVALFFLSVSISFSQEESPVFTVSPTHFKVGDVLSIRYTPRAQDTLFKDVHELFVDAVIYRKHISDDDNVPARVDAPLNQEGTAWVGTLSIGDGDAKYILFRVSSGGHKDDNNGKCWDALVYGADDKPVKGAHLLRGGYYAGWGYYYITRPSDVKDSAKAQGDLRRELELYPDDYQAELDLWNVSFHEKPSDEHLLASLKSELDRYAEKYKDNEVATYRVFGGYNRLGDSVRAKQIRAEALQRDPHGIIERRMRWSEISAGKPDPAKKVLLEEQFFKEFPNLNAADRRNKRRMYFTDLLAAKLYDAAYDMVKSGELRESYYYNELAWALIEKGEQLERATGWAKDGVELARNPDPATRSISISRRQWEEGKGSTLGMILDTYGFGLYQLGKFSQAETNYREAFTLLGGDDVDVNLRYMECLAKNDNHARATEVGIECVKKNKSNPRIIELTRQSIAAASGSSESYESVTSEQKNAFETLLLDVVKVNEKEMRKKILESRISKPSIDFTLKGLDGKPVTLSSLKEKVVVVDFWATWCGPCKSSFPFVQKVYDKFKADDKVKFLAVDCWERIDGYAATLVNARKFMETNGYTFPVLIDDVTGTRTVDKYAVDGIPTQFIIDKRGAIAFRNVGFGGPEMEDELALQVQILLDDSMGSLR